MRLLIVDDHPVLRAGLAIFLRGADEGCVVVEAGSVEEGLRLARSSDLDAAFVDLNLPDASGASVVRAFALQAPSVPLVVISASEDPRDVRAALAMGALGYVPKSAQPHTILSALRLVLSGNVYVPPFMAAVGQPTAPLITNRQAEVLELICEGRSNKDICETLGLSEKTVKAHVTSIFKALNVENRTQAAIVARREALLPFAQQVSDGGAELSVRDGFR